MFIITAKNQSTKGALMLSPCDFCLHPECCDICPASLEASFPTYARPCSRIHRRGPIEAETCSRKTKLCSRIPVPPLRLLSVIA